MDEIRLRGLVEINAKPDLYWSGGKKILFPTTIAAETHKLDDWSNKTHEMAFKSTTHSV